MMTEEYFNDPRLARLYDKLCDGRDDIEFYLALADEIGAMHEGKRRARARRQ